MVQQYLENVEESNDSVQSIKSNKQCKTGDVISKKDFEEARIKNVILSEIAFAISKMPIESAMSIRAVAHALDRPKSPDKAPELYKNRIFRGETPPEFIKRVYSDYLESGLTKIDLRELDEPLLFALYAWSRKHKQDIHSELNLLTKSEVVEKWVGKVLSTDENLLPYNPDAKTLGNELLNIGQLIIKYG